VTRIPLSFPAKPLSRRGALLLTAGALTLPMTAVLGRGGPALAQRRKPGPAEIPMAELMEAGPLPDLVLGKSDAPVTIIEYASMTCGHCANFHKQVFPALKQKYIDTGQVRFIFREFPLDDRAAAASMLARCSGEGKTFPLVSALFDRQEDWAYVRGSPVPELFKLAKQAGFTQESFDKCLRDDKLLKDVTAVKDKAAEKFGVNATPTFFINGKRMQAAATIEEFDKMLAPMLKS
jgi:protein-disulfide isomerase